MKFRLLLPALVTSQECGGKLPTSQNITGQELELLAAWRMIGAEDKKLIFKMAKYWQKEAQKEKEPADAATRQQACTE